MIVLVYSGICYSHNLSVLLRFILNFCLRIVVTMVPSTKPTAISTLIFALPLLGSVVHALPLHPRVVPLPPSTYVHGAKIATKIIVILVVTLSFFTIAAALLCYCCCKRRKSRARRRRLEKERAESKQLKPRINGRNARFFAPGMVDVELKGWKSPNVEVNEIRRPGRAWLGGRWGSRR